MTLELTKSELERLLEIMYLGEEVLNGHRHESGRSAPHDEVLEKIHALADDEGLGYLVDRDEDGGTKPSQAMETRLDAGGWLQDYDDCVFWDELAMRLAERDLKLEIGTHAYDALPHHDRHERVDALAEGYDREFDARGIERLRLDRPHRARRGDALTERLKKLFKDSK